MKLPPGYVAGVGVHKATAYGGYGQRMLEKMGWLDGDGLGKEKDGMKAAIEVKKKEDTLGVGTKGSGWNWEAKYWEEAYNSAVQKVNHASDSDSSSSDSDASSDEEDAPKARKGAAVNRDGTLASASRAEMKIAAALAKDPWGRWGGRGGKMARIQAQEAEEAEAKRKALGLKSVKQQRDSPAKGTGKKQQRKASSDSSSDTAAASTSGPDDSSDDDVPSDQRRAKRARQAGPGSAAIVPSASSQEQQQSKPPVAAPPKRLVVVLGGGEERLRNMTAQFKPTPATGWWGAKMFATGGLMESLEESTDPKVAERNTFNEDDQTNLYMKVHDGKAVGKRGLGKSETLKIAGGKWEGSKTTFEEGEQTGQQEEGATARALAQLASDSEDEQAPAAKSGKKSGKKGKKSDKGDNAEKKRRVQKGSADSEGEGQPGSMDGSRKAKRSKRQKGGEGDEHPAEGSGEQTVKPQWIKLARAMLKESGKRRLKLQRLVRSLVQSAQQQHIPTPGAAAFCPDHVAALLTRKAQAGHKHLAVDGQFISLRSQ